MKHTSMILTYTIFRPNKRLVDCDGLLLSLKVSPMLPYKPPAMTNSSLSAALCAAAKKT
jgi:hypothetical protein